MGETELLVLTADDHLAGEVARLAAAAGASPRVLPTAAAGLRDWAAARTVLVGADLAGEVASLGPPRREGVHVLGLAAEPSLRDALACAAESVLVLPRDDESLVRLLSDAVDGTFARGQVVGVVGGAGGAGSTVFATALALACSVRGPTVLVDADSLGAGVDQVLGLDPDAGIRWDALLHAGGRIGARSLREALPRRDGLAVLAWPRTTTVVPSSTLREVLSAARRGFGTVVLALPRHPDALGEELVPRCDRIVVVSTRSVPAVAAAERVLARLPRERACLVLRGSAGVPAAQVGGYLGIPVAATMADQRGLDEALSLGAGPLHRRGPLARAVVRVALSLEEAS
ncbi:MAG: septum site determining protein [Nocardioidaceae bacterium]|nr:septum site determining protein [Nocardioidaceae bacterium]